MLQASPDITKHVKLGESPLYREQDNTLHYIDVLGKAIHITSLSAPWTHRTIACPEFLTFLNFAEGGGYIVCYFRGLALVGEDGSWQLLREVVDDERASQVRLNDGAVDAKGRLWFGELDLSISGKQPHIPNGYEAPGKLYRFDPDGTLTVHESSGIICANGTGWTRDNKVMLFSDSKKKIIWGYDYDLENGVISKKRVLVDLKSVGGEPDGLLLDSKDNIYSFLWEGSGVAKFDLAGNLLQRLDLNAWRVTHGAWVGPRLDHLVITSADTDDGTRPWPNEQGGHLFWIRGPGEVGQEKHLFKFIGYSASQS